MPISTEQRGKCKPRGKPIQKGEVRNPGGRPKKIIELTALCQKNMPEYVGTLHQLATGFATKDVDKIQAIKLLLAYGYGSPMQRQELSGPNGGPIRTSAVDLSKLTTEELAALEKALCR